MTTAANQGDKALAEQMKKLEQGMDEIDEMMKDLENSSQIGSASPTLGNNGAGG